MKTTNSKTLRGSLGAKLKGPGTATSDDIPGVVVETQEPIRVANGERILNPPQERVLKKVAKKKGFGSVDGWLEDETGEPVGPTLKYTEGKDDVDPVRHASGGMFDGLKRVIGITPESPEMKAYKADAAAKREAAKTPTAAAPATAGVYAGRDGAGGNSMVRREKAAGLDPVTPGFSGGGIMGVIEANPVHGFKGLPVEGPTYAHGGKVGPKKSFSFGGTTDDALEGLSKKSSAVSKAINAKAAGPTGGNVAVVGTERTPQTSGTSLSILGQGGGGGVMGVINNAPSIGRGFKPLRKTKPTTTVVPGSDAERLRGEGVPGYSGGGLMGVIEKEVSNYIKGTPSYSGGGIMGEINNGPVGTRGGPPQLRTFSEGGLMGVINNGPVGSRGGPPPPIALRNGGEIHADLGGMWENAKRAVTGRPAETVQEKYARKDAAAAARNPTVTAPAPTPVAATPAPMGSQSVIDRRMKAAGLRNGGEVCMEGGGLFDTLRSAFSTKAPRFSPTATLGIRGQVGGDLVTGHGGDVPGKGKGDKIPAKYEPGEFVVSNAMLDAKPKLRGELRSLRKDVLADQGMTPAEADAKALKGTGLRAAVGFEGIDPKTGRISRRALIAQIPTGGVGDEPTAQPDPSRSVASPNMRLASNLSNALAPVAGAASLVPAAGRLGALLGRSAVASGTLSGVAKTAPYAVPLIGAAGLAAASSNSPAAPPAAAPEPDFTAANNAKIAAANAADAAAKAPAKLGDVRNVDNEAGTQDVFTNGAWTTVSTPGAKAARGLRDEQYQQRLKDDFDAATTGPNGWKTRADAADAREKAADDERKFEASLAGLTPQQMVAARQQRLGTTTGLDGERLKADSLLRMTQMNNDTQLRTTGMTTDANMRNSRLASSVAAQKAQMEQFNNDREYAMNVAKYGVEAADKARAASESSARAMNDRMERMWRTNVDGKDVPDTAKIAEYTQNIQATIPDYISRLLQENTPEAKAKAADLQKRGPAALTDTDHELFRTLQLTKERIEKTRGVLTGSSHKNSASLLGYRQKAGTSLRDGEFQADNGSTSRASDLMYNEPANVILPDWLKTKDDTLTRGLR